MEYIVKIPQFRGTGIQIADICSEKFVDVNCIVCLDGEEGSNGRCEFTLADYYYDALLLSKQYNEDELNLDFVKYVDYFKCLVYWTAKAMVENRGMMIDNIIVAGLMSIKEWSLKIKTFILEGGKKTKEDFQVNDRCTSLLKEIFDYVNSASCGLPINDYFIQGKCVALAWQRNNGKVIYYAFSGSSDDYVGGRGLNGVEIIANRQWKYDSCIAKMYKEVGKVIKSITKCSKVVECHLTLKVHRYTDSVGVALSQPISLYKDYLVCAKTKKMPSDFERRYSCCERKILGKIGFENKDYLSFSKSGTNVKNKLNNYVFLVRIKPCVMCAAALVGCNDINVSYDFHKKYKNRKAVIKYESDTGIIVSEKA